MGKYNGHHRLVARPEPESTFLTDSTRGRSRNKAIIVMKHFMSPSGDVPFRIRRSISWSCSYVLCTITSLLHVRMKNPCGCFENRVNYITMAVRHLLRDARRQ